MPVKNLLTLESLYILQVGLPFSQLWAQTGNKYLCGLIDGIGRPGVGLRQ